MGKNTERLRKTVAADCWRKNKRLSDWSPPIFRNGGNGQFKSLIKVQKTMAMFKIYDFAYRCDKNPETGFITYALDRSIAGNKNLFIRGPHGSGRGLLIASIKMLAAMRDISATPYMDDWANLRSVMLLAKAYSKLGEETKMRLAEEYTNVTLMTLENLRGEYGDGYDERKITKRFAAIEQMDDVLSNRVGKPGSMVLSSYDFAKQIGDTLGDKIPEIMSSPNTTLILMLTPLEAESIYRVLRKRSADYAKMREEFKPAQSHSLREGVAQTAKMEEIEKIFYFEEAFPYIPVLEQAAPNAKPNAPLQNNIKLSPGRYFPDIVRLYTKFKEDKDGNTMDFQEKMQRTYIDIVKDSTVGPRMTEREMYEIGYMVGNACSGTDEINKNVERAKALREKMSGNG